MRKAFTNSGPVFGLIAFALCLSCSRRTPVQASVLAGKWQQVHKPAVTMHFQKNGTFSAYIGGERLLGGEYRLLNGEQIIMDFDASSPKLGPVTNKAFVSGEELRIVPAGGKGERYKRAEQQPQ